MLKGIIGALSLLGAGIAAGYVIKSYQDEKEAEEAYCDGDCDNCDHIDDCFEDDDDDSECYCCDEDCENCGMGGCDDSGKFKERCIHLVNDETDDDDEALKHDPGEYDGDPLKDYISEEGQKLVYAVKESEEPTEELTNGECAEPIASETTEGTHDN